MQQDLNGRSAGTRIAPMNLAQLNVLSSAELDDRMSDVEAAIRESVAALGGKGFDAISAKRFALLIAEKRKLQMAKAWHDRPGDATIRYAY